ncbi:MAG: indolepyruvate oxidoreductase subunit beta [Thermoplasmata archaeon]
MNFSVGKNSSVNGNTPLNIVVCGVGGNGVVLASRAIARAALRDGRSVRVGEVHGLAVRGGTVVSHVRIGLEEGGVIIPKGEGNLMVAFEPLEALRFMPFLRKGCPVLLNEQPFIGVTSHIGLNPYPEREEIMKRLSSRHDVYRVNASGAAEELGSIQMLNTVMMGVLAGSGLAGLNCQYLEDAVLELVPPKVADKNREAFRFGMEMIAELMKQRAKQNSANNSVSGQNCDEKHDHASTPPAASELYMYR